MEVDAESRVFRLSEPERIAVGLNRNQAVWPFQRASDLLEAVEEARERLSHVDITQFPPGPNRNHVMDIHNRQQKYLSAIIRDLTPFLPSPVAGIENYLNGQTED